MRLPWKKTPQEPPSRADTLGYFKDGIYYFHEPFAMPDGNLVEKIDFRIMQAEGISYTEIIEAMTDPHAVIRPAGADD